MLPHMTDSTVAAAGTETSGRNSPTRKEKLLIVRLALCDEI